MNNNSKYRYGFCVMVLIKCNEGPERGGEGTATAGGGGAC